MSSLNVLSAAIDHLGYPRPMGAPAIAGVQRQRRSLIGARPKVIWSRRRYSRGFSAELASRGIYVGLVSTSLAVRRDRFSKHVKRIVAHVRQTKGWTLKQLLEAAEVSKPIYYRWINGDWTSDLEASPIERFHDAAGVPVSDALDIRWPGKYGRRTATPPLDTVPEYGEIMRALHDPNTSKEDLYLIQATLDMLLTRIAREGTQKHTQ